MRDETQLDEVFSYHPPGPDDSAKYQKIRDAAWRMALVILSTCPPCADRTAALRKVREAVMTANASLALKGLI